MAFWSAPGSEPLRQYRWYVTFGSANTPELDGLRFALKKIDKPKAKIGEITHKYMNHFFYYPGRLEWEPINMTFAAVTDPNASVTLMKVLRNAGYGVPSDSIPGDQMSSIGKQKFVSSVGEMFIYQVNPDGVETEWFQLKRPFFTSVQFGSLAYDNEDIVEIQATVRYDWAQLNDNNTDVSNTAPDSDNGPNPGFPSQ